MTIQSEINELGFLSTTGLALVEYAESISNGGKFELNNKRWVIRPNNFVTFEPHWKRTTNIAISLRGNPEEFAELSELPLKEGMKGYSECTVISSSQLAGATFYIRRAEQLYTRGSTRTQKKQSIIETL